ncbi:thioesterase family protein [Paracoccus mutanolyticus]|nr:thioesterase family protein [Paracoccus mutanolyticus]
MEIGAGPDYIAQGRSYFTVESHVRYLDEVRAGETLTMTTQVLAGQGKRLHLREAAPPPPASAPPAEAPPAGSTGRRR